MTSPFTAIQSPFSSAQSYAPLTASAKWERTQEQIKISYPKRNYIFQIKLTCSCVLQKSSLLFFISEFLAGKVPERYSRLLFEQTLFALCVILSFIQNINTLVEYILELFQKIWRNSFQRKLGYNKFQIFVVIFCKLRRLNQKPSLFQK